MAAATDWESGTVLVVDDEDGLRTFMVLALEDAGYAVIEARSAREALRLLEEEPAISVIVTDIRMPGDMNGIQMLRAARSLRPGVRAVVISGALSYANQQSELWADCPYLAKPFKIDDLCALVAQEARRASEARDA